MPRSSITPRSNIRHAATRCNTRQHAATRCNTLQHIVCCALKDTTIKHETFCHALQHATTHWNTIQHAATHCNTLSVVLWRTLWCDATHTRTTSKYNIHICKSWKVTVFTKNEWSWHTFHSRYTGCHRQHHQLSTSFTFSEGKPKRKRRRAHVRQSEKVRLGEAGREPTKCDICERDKTNGKINYDLQRNVWHLRLWNTSTGGCRGQHLFRRSPLTAIVSVSLSLALALSRFYLSISLSPTRGTSCWRLHYNCSVRHFVCSTFFSIYPGDFVSTFEDFISNLILIS